MKRILLTLFIIFLFFTSAWCEEWGYGFDNHLAHAKQGDAFSQTCIGYAYYHGPKDSINLFTQDYEKAAYWFKKAAKQKSPYSQYTLGCMYMEGKGVPVNHKKAVSWLKKAAVNGHLYAPYDLGRMYLSGLGAKQDYKKAYIWYSLASVQGSNTAKKSRDLSAEHLSQKQLSQADKMIFKIQKKIDRQPKLKFARFY